MKCNECGSTGFNSSGCPDCGSGNVSEEIGGGTAAQVQKIEAQINKYVKTEDGSPISIELPGAGSAPIIDASASVMPALPNEPVATTEAIMPDVEMTADVKVVVGRVKLPDGTWVEIHEGETFSVAHEGTDEDVTFRIPDDPTDASVSKTPIKVVAEGGVGKVTGGGGGGFALDITLRFKPQEVVELPKTEEALIALLQSGNASFTATAVKVGKANRFPLKF